jgi:hypothetical protein
MERALHVRTPPTLEAHTEAAGISCDERQLRAVQQLYEGEKARNQILQSRLVDMQARLDTHLDDMQDIDEFKAQIEHYRALILQNEEAND